MNEKQVYWIRPTGNPLFNYYFDKITSIFSNFKNGPVKNPKKILFIRNDHIGDMVCSTQVFREVKRIFPEVKIYVLATSSNKEIIEKNKNVDKIIEGEMFWSHGLKGFLNYLKTLRKIKKENFDTGIDLRRSKLNMFFFLFLPRIKNRTSYYNVNGGKAFLTHPIICEKAMVNVKEITGMIEKIFGVKIENYWPEIQTDEQDEKDFQEFIEKNKIKKYAVFGPGATADSKRWPEKKFNELIKRFHKKYPLYKIVLSGANSDKKIIMRLYNHNKEICIPLIDFNLRKMALIFKNSGVVVANDGCGTDISWVAGGKLVSLVGPVDKKLHIPQRRDTIFIHHKLPCHPCDSKKPCKKPFGKWCMDLITVDEVIDAINEHMKKTR